MMLDRDKEPSTTKKAPKRGSENDDEGEDLYVCLCVYVREVIHECERG